MEEAAAAGIPVEDGMPVFSKEHLPPTDDAGWGDYHKKVPTRAIKIDGPFRVETSEDENQPFRCEDGYLAIDARGYPYAIASEEFGLIYEPVGEQPEAEAPTERTPAVLAEELIAATESNPSGTALRHVLEAFITAETEDPQPDGGTPANGEPAPDATGTDQADVELPEGLGLGRIVIYRSKTGNYDLPAIVNCTSQSIDPEGVAAGHVPELSSPNRVHLTVFTCGKQGTAREDNEVNNEAAGGSYQEFNIPQFVVAETGAEEEPSEPRSGTWRWPGRV